MGLFGGNLAENIVEMTAAVTASVMYEAIQDAGTTINFRNHIDINPDCEFRQSIINQGNAIKISQDVLMGVKNSTKIAQTVEIMIKQMAEAVVQNLSLRLGDNEASNQIQLFQQMSQKVSEVILQGCFTEAKAENEFSCQALAEGLVINQNNFIDVVKKCVIDKVSETDLQQKFSAAFDQSASAVEKNALAWIALIIGGVIAIVVLFLSTGKTVIKRLTNWKFVLASTPLFAFIIYLIVAKLTDRWPFAEKNLLAKNDNLVRIYYGRDTPKSPIEFCLENGYSSVSFVEKTVPTDVLGSAKKEIKVFSYDINTPDTDYYVTCRIKPIRDDCDGVECPNIFDMCCSDFKQCGGESGICQDLSSRQ